MEIACVEPAGTKRPQVCESRLPGAGGGGVGRQEARPARTHRVFSLAIPNAATLLSISNKEDGGQINVVLVRNPTLSLLGSNS